MDQYWPEIIAGAKIVWIDLILSGDNAVVIALACRGLPERQRKWGIALGALAAILLRIIFALLVVQLLTIPFLKVAGGLLLLRIAVNLVAGHDDSHGDIRESGKLWQAIWTVAVADAVMSLDNVIAIAAVAQDHVGMLIFGLALSIPLIVLGANLLLNLLGRFPFLVWAGAGLLGWVSGTMMITDYWVVGQIGQDAVHTWESVAGAAGAVLVLAVAYAVLKSRGRPVSLRPPA
ncbi:TerC family protein [Chelatococcus reniformis]|uniref:TerC family protein n=1 Tax=Chelatococcus reniformis TaxID=1494448 RepID=A0A916XM92_9HYPH|nr:TerC family protein [Chelatococcus reniformis]GGC83628.1 hypothetical protein GCM10010994_46890 [Chelatococcus reniformis]